MDINSRIKYLEDYLEKLNKNLKDINRKIRCYNTIVNINKMIMQYSVIVLPIFISLLSINQTFVVLIPTIIFYSITLLVPLVIRNKLKFLNENINITRTQLEIYTEELSMRKRTLEREETINKSKSIVSNNNCFVSDLDYNNSLSLKIK